MTRECGCGGAVLGVRGFTRVNKRGGGLKQSDNLLIYNSVLKPLSTMGKRNYSSVWLKHL